MKNKKQKTASSISPLEKIKKYYLFNPGPVMVSDEVRKKLLLPDICHREEEFTDLFNNISKKLLSVFKANQEFIPLFITGSGTSAIESLISSCINKKVLCISNGAFGERWNEIISLYNIDKVWLKYGWGEYPNLEEIEKILDVDGEIDSVLMVYSETSTGMLNPVKRVGELTKKYDKLFLVDAVSSLAVDDVNVMRDNIDFCASCSHKGINGIPGLSMICANKSALDKIKDTKPRNYYLDLKRYFEYGLEKSQTPATPAVQAFYALDAALDELLKEGVDNRIKRMEKYSNMIRSELWKSDFKLLLKDHFSNGITSVIVPSGYSYKKIHDYLKEKGFVIYGGKGLLLGKIFQISIMGAIEEDVINKFLNVLGEIRRFS